MRRVGVGVLLSAMIVSLLVGGGIGFVAGNRTAERKSHVAVPSNGNSVASANPAASGSREAEKSKPAAATESAGRELDLYSFAISDCKAIKAMIDSGISKNDNYFIQEVKLQHVQLPSAKVFYVVCIPMSASIGLEGVLVTYYTETKILNPHPEHLKGLLETREYNAESTEELLALASEVVPLMYGCVPEQHKLLTESDGLVPGHLPVTKGTILGYKSNGGLFVNYYAKLGHWSDTANVNVVLKGKQLRVSISPIIVNPHSYE